MVELKEYYLSILTEGGEWKQIVKSYECDSLIYAAILRMEKGEICRVLDNQEKVLWHAKGAPMEEDAPHNG